MFHQGKFMLLDTLLINSLLGQDIILLYCTSCKVKSRYPNVQVSVIGYQEVQTPLQVTTGSFYLKLFLARHPSIVLLNGCFRITISCFLSSFFFMLCFIFKILKFSSKAEHWKGPIQHQTRVYTSLFHRSVPI